MKKINDRFINEMNGKEYVIKGAWDGRYQQESMCFLMCFDFKDNAYVECMEHK